MSRTVTIFGDTTDGHSTSTDATYTNARDGLGTISQITGSSEFSIGQFPPGTVYDCREGAVKFDCSTLVATVSSALLNLFNKSGPTTDFVLEARNFDWGATLTDSDFQNASELGALTLLGSINTSALTTDTYDAFSDVAMTALVDIKSSATAFILCSSLHRTGTAPTTTDLVAFSSANATGTSEDPYLEVIEATPAVAASGAAVANATNANLDVPYPSGPVSGEPLVLIYSSSSTAAPDTPTDWVLEADSGATDPRTLLYSILASGSETGNLAVVNSDSSAKIARMHRLDNCDSFEAAATNTGTSKTPGHPSITTTEAVALILCAGGVNDNETAASFTGESGGDLVIHSQDGTADGTDHLLYLQTVLLTATGTVSGGTWTYSGATEDWSHCIIAAFKAAGGNKTLAVDAGTYSLVGVTANLEFGYALDTDAGSYSLVGIDANLEFGYALDTDAGSYSLVGIDADLEFGYAVDTTAGSYSLSGVNATLQLDIPLAVAAGSYAVTGIDASLEFGFAVDTDAGAYSLVGIDAALEHGFALDADAGVYSLSGVALTLQLDIPLSVDAGVYALSGVDASLEFGFALDTTAGSYSLTGVDADLNKGRSLATSAGSYLVSGVDADLTHEHVLTATAGSYSLAGVDADLNKGATLATGAGAYSVSGIDAALEFGFALLTAAGSYSVSGVDASLEFGFVLATAAGSYSASGVDASLEFGFALDTVAGSYFLSGVDAALTKSSGFIPRGVFF